MTERRASNRRPAAPTEATRPARGTDRLKKELERYIEARIQLALEGLGHRMGDTARRVGQTHLGPRRLVGGVARRGKALRERLPTGAAVTSTAAHAKDTAAHARDTVVDKAKGVTGVTGRRHDKSDAGPGKGLTIIEDIDVGAPVPDAYDEWMIFQESDRLAKTIKRPEDSITEEIADERIAWTTEMDHATARGVVTFHPLGENLTKVLLVLRYFPKGPVERAESLLRVQTRRARRDLKRYRTFVMMREPEEEREDDEAEDEGTADVDEGAVEADGDEDYDEDDNEDEDYDAEDEDYDDEDYDDEDDEDRGSDDRRGMP
ncbi:SRPBCC family protein [Streptomyces sp. enrichment culture]|uniref:SRPBCC family protein n=1 Tax=Streptomyces sp. enrichment culture TaxID=1795815 RepID=UPI003F56A34C